jgi:very-short-patch-repair endonuclease
MDYQIDQRTLGAEIWALVERQHGVISRPQLIERGLHPQAIKHRAATRRLHVVAQGVYAVGRPEISQYGMWMAAVLACGPGAALSHFAAAGLWGIRPSSAVEVSVPRLGPRRRPGIGVHRRRGMTADDVTTHREIPVTTPACTLVDCACRLPRAELERAISEADQRGLIDPEELRNALEHMPRRPGIAVARETLDRQTFVLSRSELERLFFPLARRAGLSKPLTLQWVNGFEVDFYLPDLGLVVETDGLRYHRTPAQQAQDRYRDQVHAACGLTPLRFSHGQVKFRPSHVESTLAAVAERLGGGRVVASAGARSPLLHRVG